MKTKTGTAVVVFGFVRAEHIERLLSSLYKNSEASGLPVFVKIDGGRTDEEKMLTAQVAEAASLYVPRANVTVAKFNRGVRRAIVEGVSEVLETYDSVIVLEDDLVVSQFFLRFMLEGISRYSKDSRVASIHGYLLPGTAVATGPFFLRGADCWGWATWKSAWTGYRGDAGQLLADLKSRGLEHEFTFGGNSPHLRLLQLAAEGQIDSWAICWHASTFLRNQYTLYPGESLVMNHGHDGSGTHTPRSASYDTPIATAPISIANPVVSTSKAGWSNYSCFYRKKSRKRKRRDMIARLRFLASQTTVRFVDVRK